jgi:hypothetical protein
MATAATAPAVLHRPYRIAQSRPRAYPPNRESKNGAKAGMSLNALNFLRADDAGKASAGCGSCPKPRARDDPLIEWIAAANVLQPLRQSRTLDVALKTCLQRILPSSS